MGKGDKRTKKGKIWCGSHGKTRSRRAEKIKSGKIKAETSTAK